MCRKSLCTREGSRRAQASCHWGQLWSFFLLLVVILRSAEEGGRPQACRAFSHMFYSFFVPSRLPEGGDGILPLAEMVGLTACLPRACEIPTVVSVGSS